MTSVSSPLHIRTPSLTDPIHHRFAGADGCRCRLPSVTPCPGAAGRGRGQDVIRCYFHQEEQARNVAESPAGEQPFHTADFALLGYIGFAYNLMLSREQQDSMVAGLPKWVSTDSFGIQAVAEGNPTKDQMRLMVQSLLADRFRLAQIDPAAPVSSYWPETAFGGSVGDDPGEQA
jgi:hypothetical protein